MESENNSGEMPAESVSASTEAPASSQDTTVQSQDLIKNLKAELNRKLSKTNETMRQELAQIKQLLTQSQTRTPAAEADFTNSPDYKRYVDARFQEAHRAEVQKAQQEAWSKAQEMFPELNPESETYDERFYKLADQIYSEFDLSKSKNAPLLAAKQAALELGKIEQLTKEKLLKDEARRSRIISEGGAVPRESKKEQEVKLNEKGLARLGINPDKLKARLKANKDKYEGI